MKIVNRDRFFAMPRGTLFAKYFQENGCDPFGALAIKEENRGTPPNDFYIQNLVVENARSGTPAEEALYCNGMSDASIPICFNVRDNDGAFEEKQLFAVFEPHDVEALIERLQRALRESQETP